MNKAINIALIGPTCAGKTTCAAHLSKKFNLCHLSTGDILRENLAQQTTLGLMTLKFVGRGELVPDEIINSMLEETVRRLPPEQGLVLDGFPSTLYQALFLEELFRETGRNLDAIIHMHVPDPVVFARAARRLPARLDDQPGIIPRRLSIFRRTTGPVLEFFFRAEKVAFLDATPGIGSVTNSLSDYLARLQQGDFSFKLGENQRRILDESLAEPVWQKAGGTHASLDFVILGAPGSGKGTHADFLSNYLKIPHVPTGNLFRDHLKNHTTLGKVARTYMDCGELVPDEVTDAVVRKRLNHPDLHDGFILDGYPRTVPQARSLDAIMAEVGRRLAGAIYLSLPDDVIVHRMTGRRYCPTCQRTYHIQFNPPKCSGVCDADNTPLIQRQDDSEATVLARLKVFHTQTVPVVDFYRKARILVEISTDGEVAVVRNALASMMKAFRKEH